MPLRDAILNNFWWKVTALLLAVGAWYGFKTRPGELPDFRLRPVYSTREFVRHPITVTKPATDTREFMVDPSEVDITVSGDLDVLKELDGRDIRATVDLSEVGAESTTVQVRVFVPPDKGLKLEKLFPSRVQVELVKQ